MPTQAGLDSNEVLQLILDSATDFAIFTLDAEGCVTSWNLGAERLTGYSEDEIIGRTADCLYTPEEIHAGVPEQERATADWRERAPDERWHVRKDGSRFWGSGLVMPLRGAQGYLKIMRDRTDAHRAQVALMESEARFRVLATSIPQLVFKTSNTGERTWASPQWESFAGLSDAQSRSFGWLEAIHPDDREDSLTGWREAPQLGFYEREHRIRRASDGEFRWHQTRAVPTNPTDPLNADWVGTSTDIHDLRMVQERQRVLMSELEHRTRNLLGIIRSISHQTAANSADLHEFRSKFDGRLEALSRVQGLVAKGDNRPVDLALLVAEEVEAHAAENKVEVDGPSVTIPQGAAQTISLVLHELATNAVKYGALGQQSGQVMVRWRVTNQGPDRRLELEWLESGVPIASEPSRRGYGSELILKALPYQLGATTSINYSPDGVICNMALPLAD